MAPFAPHLAAPPLWALLVLASAAPLAAQESDDGWVAAFDGETLDGWVTSGGRYDGTARWTVEDGCLTGRQGPNKSGGLIYTATDHANFELELEVKIDYPFDSGVFLRMTPWAKGAQVTLDHRPGGEIGGIYSDGWLQHTPEGAERFRKDEWNHVSVRCTGRDMRIDASLNGEPLVSFTLPEDSEGYARTGLVGLQVHGGEDVPDETKVQFRNIRLRDLSSYRAEGFAFADSFERVDRDPEGPGNTLRVRGGSEESAPGWRPLFDGETLAGWRGEGGDPRAELAPGGVLRIPGTGSGHLRTDELFRDFQLRLDFRFSSGANSGLFLRGDPAGGNPAYSGCELQILDDFHWEETTRGWLQPYQFTGGLYGARPPDATDALNPIGEWNVYEVTFHGGRLKVFLNGVLLHDVDTLELEHVEPPFADRAPEGFVGLQAHGSAAGHADGFVEFRNLFVRELPPGDGGDR
jgi:hypothetical protein